MSTTSSSSSSSSTQKKESLIKQFFDFLKTFGIVGLAIAFVIGQASTTLVSSLVSDIISPFISLFVPNSNITKLSFSLYSLSGAPVKFLYGDLLLQIIDFAIIAFIVFLAYKELSKFKLVSDKTIVQKESDKE